MFFNLSEANTLIGQPGTMFLILTELLLMNALSKLVLEQCFSSLHVKPVTLHPL
jgi:hypothetical protein